MTGKQNLPQSKTHRYILSTKMPEKPDITTKAEDQKEQGHPNILVGAPKTCSEEYKHGQKYGGISQKTQ